MDREHWKSSKEDKAEDKFYQVEKQSFLFTAVLTLIINGRYAVNQITYFSKVGAHNIFCYSFTSQNDNTTTHTHKPSRRQNFPLQFQLL